jgi:hypothetical protein
MMNKSLLFAALSVVALSACDNAASVASQNLSQAADNFEINRRIVFFNGITDKYLLSIEGLCSIHVDDGSRKLDVTCKVGPNEYKKHFLGLSDNVSYFSEQIEGANADTYHYRVMFRPQQIIPDIDVDVK